MINIYCIKCVFLNKRKNVYNNKLLWHPILIWPITNKINKKLYTVNIFNGLPIYLTNFFEYRCPWTKAIEHLIHEQHRNRTPKPAIHEQHRAFVISLIINPPNAIHEQREIISHCPHTCFLLGLDGHHTLLVFMFYPSSKAAPNTMK